MACKNIAGMSCAPPLSWGSLAPIISLYSTIQLTIFDMYVYYFMDFFWLHTVFAPLTHGWGIAENAFFK